MLSTLHEMLLELFRVRPSLAADLLAGVLGVPVPSHDRVVLAPADTTEVVPTEYRADAVVVLTIADDPVLAVVVEVQRSRDQHKRRSWPVYATTVQARLSCPTELLVVCTERSLARWCATPIPIGLSGSHITPLVLGPDLIPVVTDAARAEREPELAVLSAMAHGGDPSRRGVLEVLLGALQAVEEQHRFLYLGVVYAAMPAAARKHLEELMATHTEELSELAQWFVARGEAQGEARGEVRAALTVLDARGIDVPDQARRRITECGDPEQLDRWIRRAVTAEKIEDLFD